MQRFHGAMLALILMLAMNLAHADDLLPLPPDQPAQTQSTGPKETSVRAAAMPAMDRRVRQLHTQRYQGQTGLLQYRPRLPARGAPLHSGRTFARQN